jgi:hypothetical protein
MAAKGGLSGELVQICWDWLSCQWIEVLELILKKKTHPLLLFMGDTRYFFTSEALEDICVRNNEMRLKVAFLGLGCTISLADLCIAWRQEFDGDLKVLFGLNRSLDVY